MLALGLGLFKKAAGFFVGSGVVVTGSVLMESTGYVLQEDGVSKFLLE